MEPVAHASQFCVVWGMNLLRILIIAFASWAFSSTLAAQVNGMAPVMLQNAEIQPLRILSWNIYMLPKFAKITGKRQRAHVIANQMQASDFDILVFQESFLGDARRIIGKALHDSFPNQYGPANRKLSVKTNSGIWVLSKLPLKPLEEIDYVECAGFDDCFARKGALLLAGEFNGKAFQILGTHLQAGGSDAIRTSQFAEMRSLLDRHKQAEVPQIIAGDMNTGHTDTAQYHEMLSILDAEDGPLTISLPTVKGGYPNDLHSNGVRSFRVIDFVFYRANGRPANKIEREMPHFQAPWSRKRKDLSDHFPVAFSIWW
jgi:endonuclease/exonuclease/phosphatase family metal-dependent hydrolase